MARLSKGVTESQWRGRPVAPRIVALLAPALVFAIFASVTLYERAPERQTLRVVAPAEVAPNRSFPVVGRVFAHEGETLVRELEEGEIEVELRRGEEVSVRGTLSPGPQPHFGAMLTAPALPGQYTLVFRRGGAAVKSPLRVTFDPAAARLVPLPPDLRVRARRMGEEEGPSVELRVASGACVPELPCELLVVHGGERGGVAVEARAGIRLEPSGGEAASRSDAVASFIGVVLGLSAEVEVSVTGGPRRASLAAQLPVASGGVAVSTPRRILARGDSATIEFESLSEGPHRVTHHRDGALVGVHTTASAAGARLTLGPLEPGVHRVQVGGDLFVPESLARAGAVVFVVADQGEGPREALSRAERRLAALELVEPRAAADELEARALLSRLEAYRAAPPEAVTGLDRGASERRAGVSRARFGGALAIVSLGALVAAVSLRSRRRELKWAEEHAQRSGVDVPVRPARGSGFGYVLLVLLVYVLAAAVLLGRFWIFGG